MKKIGLIAAAVAILGIAGTLSLSPLREVPSGTSLREILSGTSLREILSDRSLREILSDRSLREVPSGTSLRVTRVIDGDTIVVSDTRHIRLTGIDTPEKDECYASRATSITEKLLLSKRITIQTDVNAIDTFGRTLAYVYLSDGTFVNKRLLELGTGMFFYDSVNLTHQKELVIAAEQARIHRAGLWNTCGPCIIKGNYDTGGRRYYHLPQFRHYDSVIVNLDHADRWFCTEEDAVKAGFTRARE